MSDSVRKEEHNDDELPGLSGISRWMRREKRAGMFPPVRRHPADFAVRVTS